ncbi:MAG TPA: DUF3052 domain-containing protein [Micromonosporaceae bacterium]|nr:DUF3052 domain-containing protein [Micromonosporaceae bacterium]
MSATAGQADGVRSLADRLGIESGMVVMEIGYDDDVDEDFRDQLLERVGDFVDEDTDEVVDVVLLWWRDGDGDLVDTLVDALSPLAENGVVWLLTPKAGREGHVEPSDITESAPTAGLQQTSTVSIGRDWSAARLVMPRATQKRR